MERRQRCSCDTLDDDTYEVAEVEDQWYSPEALYFKVLTQEGQRFVLRYDEQGGVWNLQSGFDGDALL